MLVQNLKWAFLTIMTCIEKSEECTPEQQLQNVSGDDTQERAVPQLPIMADLVCFGGILRCLLDELNKLISSDHKKNSQYYQSTLEKLINRLFIVEEEDGKEGDELDQ